MCSTHVSEFNKFPISAVNIRPELLHFIHSNLKGFRFRRIFVNKNRNGVFSFLIHTVVKKINKNKKSSDIYFFGKNKSIVCGLFFLRQIHYRKSVYYVFRTLVYMHNIHVFFCPYIQNR